MTTILFSFCNEIINNDNYLYKHEFVFLSMSHQSLSYSSAFLWLNFHFRELGSIIMLTWCLTWDYLIMLRYDNKFPNFSVVSKLTCGKMNMVLATLRWVLVNSNQTLEMPNITIRLKLHESWISTWYEFRVKIVILNLRVEILITIQW